MSEYAITLLGMLFISGVLSLLCYGQGRAEKAAVGIITAFVILSPVVSAASSFDISEALTKIPFGDYDSDADPSTVAEEGFAQGIKNAVCENFLINKENISVKINDFDMKNMKCREIVIFLSGSAVMSDYRGIESYIEGLGMGECRVEIQLGRSS